MNPSGPIGVFDSGMGGISVLRCARQLLPGEDFLYYGDSANAPYGTRSLEEVHNLSIAAVEYLIDQGCKAVVIACNTATSAAAETLRQHHPDVPIFGIEPAVKLAVERHPGGRILVMATVRTLSGQRFLDLRQRFDDQAEIVSVPGTGLVEFVEQGILEGDAVEQKLLEILSPYVKVPVDAVVLGCTHYPFLRKTLRKVLGRGPELLDGAEGLSRQLKRRLEELNLRNPRAEGGTVEFRNSRPDDTFLTRSAFLLHCEAQ